MDPSFFTVLLGNTIVNALLGGVLSATVTYDLTCVVDGATRHSTDTGFVVNSASNTTHTINLQNAVGSPAPNSCTVANLKVSSLLSAGIPAICADVTGNRNAGTVVQAFTCESDLADNWLQVSTHQLVHNGDCMDNAGGTAMINHCRVFRQPHSAHDRQLHRGEEPAVEGSRSNPRVTLTAKQQCVTASSDNGRPVPVDSRDGTFLRAEKARKVNS